MAFIVHTFCERLVFNDILFLGYNHEALQKVMTDPKNVAALINRPAMGKIFTHFVMLANSFLYQKAFAVDRFLTIQVFTIQLFAI